jgi:hypothetical protein
MNTDLIDTLRSGRRRRPRVLTARRPRGDLSAWEQDWRKRVRGKALAVVRPGQHRRSGGRGQGLRAPPGTSIVPQGGNTGLAVGSTPDDIGHAGRAEPDAHERRARHRRRQPHHDGGGRLHPAKPAGTAEKPVSCSR